LTASADFGYGNKHESDEQTFVHEFFLLALVASEPYKGVFPEALVIIGVM
jgi:hypothetical protein